MASTPMRSPSGRQASRAERVEERRTQLAQSALATLGELGYARTSLREIAQNSEFTHGVVHYYFADKVELITHCVRLYKTQCVNRFDEIVITSRSADELLGRFAAKLVETMTTEAPLHRLWYDLRTQSLFEEAFREDVLEIDRTLQGMIWRVVARYAELSAVTPRSTPRRRTRCSTVFSRRLCWATCQATEAAPRLADRCRVLAAAAISQRAKSGRHSPA